MAQKHTSGQGFDEDATPDDEATAPAVQASTDAVDDLLDEIDGSLQVNAEQFVRSFVQKGGQ